MSLRKSKNMIRQDQHLLLDLDKERQSNMVWILAPDPDSPYNLAEMEPDNSTDPEGEKECRLEDMEPATDVRQ